MDPILRIPVIDGPVPWVVYGLSVIALLFLLVRKPTTRRVVTGLLALVVGALVGLGLFVGASLLDVFGTELPTPVAYWTVPVFAAIGLAVVSLGRRGWWRRVLAGLSIVSFALSGVIGINAYYGLNPNVGAMLGVSTQPTIAVPRATSTAPADPSAPLYRTWKPPSGMPAVGKLGSVTIPSSGFEPRQAGLYLPPAALVKDPPRLPLVIFMMGFPGNPDPQYIGAALDAFAAKHDGLAPIAVVPDQIGTKGDPACADSTTYGKAETYVTSEVVRWAKSHLNVLSAARYWTIGGYSNGGACAFKYAAEKPGVFGNMISVSGEEYAGSEDRVATVAKVFGGSTAAFDAAKPTSILKRNPGRYAHVTAVFTVGGSDPVFIPGVRRNAAAARAAGMTTTLYVVPGAGHVADALTGGLKESATVLGPVLGLGPP